jgi:hypothetical protein
VRFLVVGFAVSAMSCLAPTEIVLVLSTDVACAVVAQNGVAIALGAPGDEDSGIATSTKLCSDDGGIGTAVLLPHTSLDQPIGIRVTLGVDAAADNCGPSFAGCIVARRSLRFDPHTPLTLPIDLDQACIGVPCTPDSTCVSGSCVEAGVECDGSSCGLPDAGIVDGGRACEVVNDVEIHKSTGAEPARVALSNDGWAVAYQTLQLGVEVADVHVFGGTTNISQPLTIAQPNTATALGPFGGDGTSYAVSYGNTANAQAFLTLAGLDGVPLTGTFSLGSYRLAHYGMPSVGPQQYATAFIQGASNAALLQSFAVSANPGNNAGIAAMGLAEINLVRGSSTFYATTTDQTASCVLYQCTYNTATAFSCAQLSTFAPPCTAVRVAERLGKASHVVASKSALLVDETYPLPAQVLGTSFQIVATRDAYQIVYATLTGGLAISTYTGNGPPTTQQFTSPAGSVLGIDAVADGPNEPGYSVAYTAVDSTTTNSVRFMHLCQ